MATETASRWPIRVPAENVRSNGEYPGRHLGAVFSDMLLHATIGVIVGFWLAPDDPNLRAWLFFLTYVAASSVNRVLVQWAWQRTVGKALFKLRIVREDTRGRVSFWSLVGWWLLGSVAAAFGMMLEGLLNGL